MSSYLLDLVGVKAVGEGEPKEKFEMILFMLMRMPYEVK